MEKQNDELNDLAKQDADQSEDVQSSAELPVAVETAKEVETEVEEKVTSEESEVLQQGKEGLVKDSTEEVEGQTEEPEDETHEVEEEDFQQYDKEQLVEAIVALKEESDMRKVDRDIKGLKVRFDELFSAERQAALDIFLSEEGADEDDFQYAGSELDVRFNDYYHLLREKRHQYFKNLEQEKEKNLQKKEDILGRIRDLVDGEETNVSIKSIRALQDEWKSVGPIPNNHNRTLWANYHALLDRFYDARSIYFELKELDRKKNYDQKLELCERAEALASQENVKEAVIQLNEFHEEYKAIGPVPAEVQEALWQRFKSASDAIYVKRKDFVEVLKKELHENLEKKLQLIEQMADFSSFSSDRITEWNNKTKSLLDIQKKWEAIGGLPKEKSKDINKAFWSTFKQFFQAKNQFFKGLESQKDENLEKKKALIAKVEVLKDSNAWDKTANELKQLQQQWRDIGPVPDKERNEIYKQFKSACDYFFEQKRANSQKAEQQFEENYQEKLGICEQIEVLAKADTLDLENVYELVDRYAEIGFVPRKVIKKIHNRFDAVIDAVKNSKALDQAEKDEFVIQVQLNKLRSSPHGDRKINRKEQALKRKIQAIESDISTYKTNIEFFASSKTADKLKEEMNQSIEKSEIEIDQLKKQLKMLKQA